MVHIDDSNDIEKMNGDLYNIYERFQYNKSEKSDNFNNIYNNIIQKYGKQNKLKK